MALLRCSKIQVDKAYSRAINVLTFLKKLMNIIGITHPDTKKRVDVFALSIYGLVVFPKALGYIDEAITNLFNQLDKRVTPVPTILVETFRSLNAFRKAGEGRFTEKHSPLKEIIAAPRRDDILEEKWMAILHNLQEEDIESRQFIPTTQGIAECEFSYKGDGYKKKIREMSKAWNQTRWMKRLAVGPMTTPEYNEWWVRRINDNIPKPSQGSNQSIEEHLQVVPSELEIIREDFERRNAELEKKIEQIEEEKMNLRLDVDVQQLEVEKLRKGKNKAEEDLDSLKTDYKKQRLSMRSIELEKTSEQWHEEIREEKNKADRWERKFQEIEYLESNEDRNNEQLHYFQNQVRNRDHIMGEAVVQIREVADQLQTLAVQADTLSVKYELESDRGQELASLLKKIRVLSIRAKPYL
ncbi:hypothetical protein Goari_027409 [Gossypium aridum]|uniref:DUF7745 domain-containing protein n=1 Tax=Gossypium aridum TaxID=34290 RepID=A0A7J8YU34_GOSAI|nr:hypothetical protein [Gossypium aridum]